jgi:hypothetical protein
MGLKGLKKQVRNVAVGAASFGMLVTGVVVTAPTVAAQESEAATWEMPDVKDSMLQNAIDATVEAAGSDVAITFGFDQPAQEVLNYTNWRVCYQYPEAGEAVTDTGQPPAVYFQVTRPGAC